MEKHLQGDYEANQDKVIEYGNVQEAITMT